MSLHQQLGELDGRVVGEVVRLGVTPDEFHGIEFWRVGWQQLGTDAVAVLLEPAFDRFAGMA